MFRLEARRRGDNATCRCLEPEGLVEGFSRFYNVAADDLDRVLAGEVTEQAVAELRSLWVARAAIGPRDIEHGRRELYLDAIGELPRVAVPDNALPPPRPPLRWDDWTRPDYPHGRYDEATEEDRYGPGAP